MLIDKFILSKLLAAKWAWVELTETVSRIFVVEYIGAWIRIQSCHDCLTNCQC